ncbi:DUF4845 domain-containing protein [Acidobacteriia bacterium AH_259_A11_L15]|nr:DUF4845 domain-containing protein [Acidobacteriia bacterium AH_259_A11_L15]
MNAPGGSKLNLLIALTIAAAIILVAVRIVPVYVQNYQFEEAMRTRAKFASVERKSPEAVRTELLKEARELGLPEPPKLRLTVVPAPGGVRISSQYTVPVDLIFFQQNLNFSYRTETSTAY